MPHDTPSIAEAKEAYAALKTHYEASVIQRRIGLGNRRYNIDHIVADAGRRVRLVNWSKTMVEMERRRR